MVDAIDAVAARSIARCVGTTALRSLSLALLLQLRSLSLAPLLRISADPTSWACGYMTLNLIHTGVCPAVAQRWPVILAATGLALARMHFLERVTEVSQKWPVILAYYLVAAVVSRVSRVYQRCTRGGR